MKSKRGFLGIIGLSVLFSLASIGLSIKSFNESDSPFKADASSSSYWSSFITNNQEVIATGGSNFLTALRTKISNVAPGNNNTISYSGLWSVYKDSDPIPGSSGEKIWDMYYGYPFTYSQGQCGNFSKPGDCYNREHSVPKSWFSETDPAVSDLVHVVPTDGKVNGVRNNYTIGEVDSASDDNTFEYPARSYNNVQYQSAGVSKLGTPKRINNQLPGSETLVFEPDDQYKGDFARIYMYFAVRYGGTTCSAHKSNGASIFTNTLSDANPYVTNYGLALFQKWHVQDPVSDKETARNNVIETKQGNRNPFVDHPEWADKIFGTNYGGDTPATHTITISGSNSVEVGSTITLSASCLQHDNITTWTSSSDAIATVNSSGVVTGVTAGEATITATCAGYGSASKTITVTSSGGDTPPVGDSVTIVSSTDKGTHSGSTGDQGEDSVTKSGVTMHVTNGAFKASPYRIYQNATLTFSSTKNIIQMEFTGTASYATSRLSTNIGSFTADDDSGVWTGSSKSIAFTASAQVRLSQIVITLAGETDTLSSITLNTQNVKKSFILGEAFTSSGLVVTANYSSSSSKTVTPTSISTPNMSTIGEKTITVSYTESNVTKTATYTIVVKVFDYFTIKTAPDKVTYTAGECFDPTGLVICRVYSDTSYDEYSYADHESEFSFSPSLDTQLKVANKQIVISFNEATETQDITVKNSRSVIIPGIEQEVLVGSVVYNVVSNKSTQSTTAGVTVTAVSTDSYTSLDVDGTVGTIRLGSGSYPGTIIIESTAPFKKVTINARAFGSDTGVKFKAINSDNLTDYDEFTITSTYADYIATFDEAIDSVTISTNVKSKRMYIHSVQLFGLSSTEQDISNSEDCLGLETFIDEYMHMDYVQNLGYCADEEHHYYADAKEAFNLLNDHQRSLFTTHNAYINEWTRLHNWAEINKDTLDEDTYLSNSKIYSVSDVIGKDNKPMLLIIVAVAAVSLIGVFTLRRKEQ